MKVVHVIRKPLGKLSVAQCVLENGTGALNIDAARVAAPGEVISNHSRSADSAVSKGIYGDSAAQETHQTRGQQLGRWPANLILQHVPEELGEFARFYKQVADDNELMTYLNEVVEPKHLADALTIITQDFNEVVWDDFEDAAIHGIVAQGDPTPFINDLWRVMKTGAFIMLLAPEGEPTGHTGACAMEDAGFEIRDAILIVDEPGMHYVAKAAPKERHAGCEHLKLKKHMEKAAQPVFDELEAELIDEAEEEQSTVDPNMYKGNEHPTVKPREIMRRMIKDLPLDTLVVDPFMGSGSTALACLQTGHSFVGIELGEEYLEIADTRVRYWDRAESGWTGAEIESEALSQNDRPTLDLFDF